MVKNGKTRAKGGGGGYDPYIVIFFFHFFLYIIKKYNSTIATLFYNYLFLFIDFCYKNVTRVVIGWRLGGDYRPFGWISSSRFPFSMEIFSYSALYPLVSGGCYGKCY